MLPFDTSLAHLEPTFDCVSFTTALCISLPNPRITLSTLWPVFFATFVAPSNIVPTSF